MVIGLFLKLLCLYIRHIFNIPKRSWWVVSIHFVIEMRWEKKVVNESLDYYPLLLLTPLFLYIGSSWSNDWTWLKSYNSNFVPRIHFNGDSLKSFSFFVSNLCSEHTQNRSHKSNLDLLIHLLPFVLFFFFIFSWNYRKRQRTRRKKELKV